MVTGLDLFQRIRSTSAMPFSDTHVKCQRIDSIDIKKHLQKMARQRCVGAHGNCTGYQ